MKRPLCIYAILTVLVSLASLFLGELFCMILLPLLFASAITLAILILVLKKRWLGFVLLPICLLIATVSLVLFIHLPRLRSAQELDGCTVRAQGEITSASKNGEYLSLTVKCDEINGKSASQNVSLIVRGTDDSEADIGRRISFSGELSYSNTMYNKGNECFLTSFPDEYHLLDDMSTVGRFIYTVRKSIREASSDMRYCAMVRALVIGDKSELDRETVDAFAVIGTSHVLAISGLHLSIIIMTLYHTLSRGFGGHRLAALLSILLALFYMAITGFSLSLIRAAQMTVVFFASKFMRRQNDGITSLFSALLVIILISPWSLFNIGFLLSFFATLGIILFVPPIATRYQRYLFEKSRREKHRHTFVYWMRSFAGGIITSAATTVAATVTTLPIIILVYNRFSPFSVIGNLVTVGVGKYFLMVSFASVMTEILHVPFVYVVLTFLSDVTGWVFTSLTRLLAYIAPEPMGLNTAFLEIGVCFVVAYVAIFAVKRKDHFSLPALTASLVAFILQFNLLSGVLMDSVVCVDAVSDSGCNTAIVDIRGETYLLDNTGSPSQKLGTLVSTAELGDITHVNNAVFISDTTVYAGRVEACLALFSADKVTVISPDLDDEELYFIRRMCKEKGIRLIYSNAWRYRIRDGITAYLEEGVGTSFIISQGGNDLAIYRSVSDTDHLIQPLRCDVVLYSGDPINGRSISNTKSGTWWITDSFIFKRR